MREKRKYLFSNNRLVKNALIDIDLIEMEISSIIASKKNFFNSLNAVNYRIKKKRN